MCKVGKFGTVVVMSDEPKDIRLPLMVTRSEAAAIDDFRFGQRLPSRAEAIRRLIELGLEKAAEQREKAK